MIFPTLSRWGVAAGFAIAMSHGLWANTAIEAKPVEWARWQERHQGYKAKAKQGGVAVLFLGDSITQFWSDARYGKKVWEAELLPLKAENFGSAGDRTQHLLWRLQDGETEGLSPKAVVILIGTNNLGMERNRKTPRNRPEEAAEGVKAVLAEAKQRLPSSKVLLLGVLPRGKTDAMEWEQVRELNRLIAPLHDGKQVFYLDIGEHFLDANGELDRKLIPDGVHPGEEGYRAFAGAIKGTLEEWLAQP